MRTAITRSHRPGLAWLFVVALAIPAPRIVVVE
jgi:hypothetical protein